MDVSIIIVNYNTLQLTRNCIDSIFQKTKGVQFEVILVDNGSVDGSESYFKNDSRINYHYSPVNLGFGRANNLGFHYASGKYVFLLNSDTYLINNSVYLLWQQMELLEASGITNVAFAGSMLRDKENSIVHSYARFPSKSRFILYSYILYPLKKLHIINSIPSTSNYNYSTVNECKYFEVDYITGADLMIRSDIVNQYGLFDPDFFMYFEETELQYRYKKCGYKSIVSNLPLIVHLEGKSNTHQSPKKRAMIMKSRMLYFKKTSSPLSFFLFRCIFVPFYSIVSLLSFPFTQGKCSEKISLLYSVIKI